MPVFTVATIVILCVYYAALIVGLIYVAAFRARLRRKLELGPCCCECCLVCWCLNCALCQVSAASPREHAPGRVRCACLLQPEGACQVPSLSACWRCAVCSSPRRGCTVHFCMASWCTAPWLRTCLPAWLPEPRGRSQLFPCSRECTGRTSTAACHADACMSAERGILTRR